MPLRATYPPLFSQPWVDELKTSPELSQVATVTIVNPKSSQRVYNALLDTWTTAAVTAYTGPARVQPLRSASAREVRGNETTTQTFLFSLPIGLSEGVDFRTGFIATVTESPLNAALLNYQYVLTEITDSSNPVERTLVFTVNQETVV